MHRSRLPWLLLTTGLLASCNGKQTPPIETSTHGLTRETVADRYIVVLKKGAAQRGVAGRTVPDVAADMKHKYGGRVVHAYQHALQGMAMNLPQAALENLRRDPRVDYIEPDAVVSINDAEPNATWGLDRVDQRLLPLNQTYVYPGQAGAGVHAYVVDTGVFAAHGEFANDEGSSRVVPGYDFVDNDSDPDDCNGHGTHVAGTIAGRTYGLAQKATLHSVRVLDCGGYGTWSGVIAGIDWVAANHVSPATANMSLGGGLSQAVNDAVTNAVASGVIFGVAAGNSSANACSYSPASTPNAITVGATTSTDAMASYSNYGPCLDIFAPGSNITSSWIGGTTATNTISGTSMATPHVVGAVALWLGLHPTATPAEVVQALTMRGTPNLVTNPGTGSPNVLLYTGNLEGGGDTPQVAYVGANPAAFEGGTSAVGTVLLTDVAPAGSMAVTLSSSNPTLVTVPASVTVMEGAQGTTFTMTTAQAQAETAVTLTATDASGTTVTATVTVLASPTPTALTLAPTSVAGGSSSTATVTLSGAAPEAGAVVTLTSANPSIATVPATLTIPAGSTSGTFVVTTLPLSSSAQVAISAAYHGLSRSATLSVTMTPGLSSITVSPLKLEGGKPATGTLYLNTTAPTGGAAVALASSDPAVIVPASVTVSAGLSSASFAIATSVVAAPIVVTLSATYPAGLTKTATLSVVPSPTPTGLALAPNPVSGGNASTATLTLSGPAPTGGSVVTLSSSNTSAATVPASIVVPAGASSATFTVTTFAQPATYTSTLSATLNGMTVSSGLTVTRVLPPGNAVYDSVLKAPKCATVGAVCDSGGLIDGRATLGPETNAPNTLGGGCADGTAGSYHSDESLDRLKIATVDGTNLGPGKAVKIEGTVWAWSSGTSDHLDLYLTTDAAAASPAWTLLTPTTLTPTSGGTVVLSLTTTLPATGATLWAVRGNFRYSTTAGVCTTGGYDDRDDLIFAVDGITPPTNTAPVVDAGADQTVTLPAAAALAGTVTDDGLPNPPAALTTTWSAVSGPGTVSFANPSARVTTASFSTAGAYTLRLTASDGELSTTDDLVVTVNPPTPVNTPPTVNAGSDQSITLPATASLVGVASDDGLPNPPATLTTTWSVVSGTGTVTFADPSALATSAAFSAAGTYTLRLTVSDSELSSIDEVVVTVAPIVPVNQSPTVNAGTDQTVTLPAAASLLGVATDDGLPNPPATLTTTWSVVNGPGTVTFADANALATTATFATAGSYTLRLTANDSALVATDEVVVTVNPAPPVNLPPTVMAGADQTITLPAAVNLAATVTDDGLPNPPATVTTTWSKVSGTGTVTFTNGSSKVTSATFSMAGSYTLRLTAHDGALSASDDLLVTVNAAPINTPPVVNAGADQSVTLPAAASLSGSVSDDGLPNPPATVTTTWSKVGGPGTVTFANPSAKVTTATFSVAGSYTLRLSASDSALSASDDVVITVGGTSSPCAGICSNPTNFSINGSFQSGNLGSAAACYQTTATLHGGNCGNFVSPRTLKVNGTTEPCTGGNWPTIPAKVNGGYCIQITAGNQPWAYFTAW